MFSRRRRLGGGLAVQSQTLCCALTHDTRHVRDPNTSPNEKRGQMTPVTGGYGAALSALPVGEEHPLLSL